jgi:hypothetical protein
VSRAAVARLAFAVVAAAPLVGAGQAMAHESCLTASTAFTVLDFSSRSLEPEVWVLDRFRTRVQKCHDERLRTQIMEGSSPDQLLNQRIVMAVIEEGDELRYYVIASGVSSFKPPSESRCAERPARRDRWKALLGAAIALYEARPLLGNPCSDPRGALGTLKRAQAGLSLSARDEGEKKLYQRLDAQGRAIVGGATDHSCGPGVVARQLLEQQWRNTAAAESHPAPSI